MELKKIFAVILFVLLLLVGMFYIIERNYMGAKKSLNYFSQLLENGKIGDIRLTIYYIDPWVFTLMPLDVDMLVNNSDHIINIENLEEYVDLLKQIGSDDLIQVEHKSRLNARFYYIFKTKNNRKLFDVAMWGDDFSIYVNGLEVQENDIFYKIVVPFLPEDMVEYLEVEQE